MADNKYLSLIHGFSGSLGAIISCFILFPIDNIKLRMQIE